MIAILAAALFVQAAGHDCRVPAAAFDNLNGSGVVGIVPAELPAREARAMERFSRCLCGPEGSVDWDPRPHKHGGFFMHPSCNRDGWNGRRYQAAVPIPAHRCPVPPAAYRIAEGAVTKADQRTLERYTQCVCGPDGANDGPIVPDNHGRYVYDPKGACERSGWNGRRYVANSMGETK